MESGVRSDPHILSDAISHRSSAVADVAQVDGGCDCIWCRWKSNWAGEAGSGQPNGSFYPPIPPHGACRSSMATSHISGANICGIAEELRLYILNLLSYPEIIRCALTCRTLYNTVKNSVELQYTIELGMQRLIPVHPGPPAGSVEFLRTLRDKASSWRSFELNAIQRLHYAFTTRRHHHAHLYGIFKAITHQQLSIVALTTWHGDVISKVIDLNTCTPETMKAPPCVWKADGLYQNTGTFSCMDETQDLMVTGEILRDSDFKYQIRLRAISTGKGHPLAHECRIVTGRAMIDVIGSAEFKSKCGKADVLGDRIALHDTVNVEGDQRYRTLCVWNWHHGGPADDVFLCGEGDGASEIRFVTTEKLLVLTSRGHIELYNVEDLSKAPQLQAGFTLPVSFGAYCHFQFPSVFHSVSSCARLTPKEDYWIWTTNPGDRVISVVSFLRSSILVISARIFFMDIPPSWFDATLENERVVPWASWGPQNSRHFPHQNCRFGIGGSRVIWTTPVSGSPTSQFQLRMADFNPFTVARGVGKVVREPSSMDPEVSDVITHLPYMEVASNRVFDGDLDDIIMNEEKLLVFTNNNNTERSLFDERIAIDINVDIIDM
ncbi:hypothetical protein DEU56DRAFT_80124 [Suillus clintonianus]|uniref:uncharacterized protein n=1 Tax=Suillus clintonianus TaxID=1904413 RepID=UPI001B86F1D7|nr:uncharacterized protein DEU56DRAFT_80124 [Suillus clintonianus]KAG2148775.1 hypothetical protein DEU56DRAFT_80124 [Suillus clintonianus]